MVISKKVNQILKDLMGSDWKLREDAIEKLAKLEKFNRKYGINCTGDCVVGDKVIFWQAVFSGTYKKPTFSHYSQVEGTIIKDSYGADKFQHTFTIELENGSKMLIKGRNLYRVATFRKVWKDENLRKSALDEKHQRGAEVRKARDQWREWKALAREEGNTDEENYEQCYYS